VEPIEEEIRNQGFDQHGEDNQRDQAVSIEVEIEDVLNAKPSRDRLGNGNLKRKNRADEDEHQDAIGDIEEAVGPWLLARRDQPFQRKAEQRHAEQNLQGEIVIEIAKETREARKQLVA